MPGSQSSFSKIAVINFSGNVGKSTLARYLLAPRMPGAALVSVESINADHASERTIRGSDFDQLQKDMLQESCAIVDVGASNVEQFLMLMKRAHGSHQDFDLYVVPCVPATKQQKDTIECVRALAALGIPADRIRIVFNLVPYDRPVESVFAPVLAFAAREQLCLVDAAVMVEENPLFAELRLVDLTIEELVSDTKDYKAAIAAATDTDTKVALANRLAMNRLAVGVHEGLDRAFEALLAMRSPVEVTPQ